MTELTRIWIDEHIPNSKTQTPIGNEIDLRKYLKDKLNIRTQEDFLEKQGTDIIIVKVDKLYYDRMIHNE